MDKVSFVRKPIDFNDLIQMSTSKKFPFKINDTVILDLEEYENFSLNLMDDYYFIRERTHIMYTRKGVWHCILVKTEDSKEGILVQSEGHAYARYAAYYQEDE